MNIGLMFSRIPVRGIIRFGVVYKLTVKVDVRQTTTTVSRTARPRRRNYQKYFLKLVLELAVIFTESILVFVL